jgi:septin family protein
MQETKVQRSQKHLDTHIHCALYMIDPTSPHYHYSLNHGLDALDIHILSRLSRITTVIPIISKADTCTTTRMNSLKSLIAQNIRQQSLRLTSFLSEGDAYSEADSEEMDEENEGDSMDLGDDLPLPLSILSPDYAEMPTEKKEEGMQHVRHYPWGFADALNPLHCDYVKLRELIFVDWRRELKGRSLMKWLMKITADRFCMSIGGVPLCGV